MARTSSLLRSPSGNQQRADAIKANREIRSRVRRPVAVPGDARLVVAGGRIRRLPGDELKGIDVLPDKIVAEREPVVVAEGLIKRPANAVVADVLCGVGIQRPPAPIGQFVWVGGEDTFHDRPDSGIVGERRALLGRQHLHVAVLLAAVFSLAAVDGKSRALPQRQADRETVVVAAGREHFAHVEKLAGPEDAVVVGPEKIAMNLAGAPRRQMQGRLRPPAELSTPVVLIDLEILDDRGGCPHSQVQLAEYVVVDQREADVLVSPTLAAGAVDLAQ